MLRTAIVLASVHPLVGTADGNSRRGNRAQEAEVPSRLRTAGSSLRPPRGGQPVASRIASMVSSSDFCGT
jgi:hypothetical protein